MTSVAGEDPVVSIGIEMEPTATGDVTVDYGLVRCADGPTDCPITSPVVATGTLTVPSGEAMGSTTYTVAGCDPAAPLISCQAGFLLILSNPSGAIVVRPVALISVYGSCCAADHYFAQPTSQCEPLGAGPTQSGDTVEVGADGFESSSEVEVGIESEYVSLGTVRADENGVVNTAIVIPQGLESGEHHVVFRGRGALGLDREARAPITLTADMDDTGGGPTWLWSVLGALLVASAGAIVLARRRWANTTEAGRVD